MKENPTTNKEWLELFKTWLEEETDGSELLVDEEWKVQVEEDAGYLITTSYLSPMSVGIFMHEEDGLYANMVVNMGMKTATMDSEKRLDIYRKLLLLNDKSQMVKYTLSGIDEEVTIRADLDMASLNKKEFSDALMHTMGASSTLASMFDLEEEYNNAWMMNIVAILASDVDSGKISIEKVQKKLEENLGFDKEAVDMVLSIIDGVLKEKHAQDDAKPDSSRGPDTMFG